MPVAKCQNCGRLTNSATSNYWLNTEPDGKTPKESRVPTVCYVAFEEGKSSRNGSKAVPGCAYKKGSKPWLDHLIEGGDDIEG
jgi:hypothetical protein